MKKDFNRFSKLTFADFKRFARDSNLSNNEKIGFPESYREGYDEEIIKDIFYKVPILKKRNKNVLDIGPGCGTLIKSLIEEFMKLDHLVSLVDSSEMLDQLPSRKGLTKIPGYFPHELQGFIDKRKGTYDVIIVYSVLHYVHEMNETFQFIDAALELLNSGGYMLLGDIPNHGVRKRFFSSKKGIEYHKTFMQTEDEPQVSSRTPQGAIGDKLILEVLKKYRSKGFETYVVPQPDSLPMSNRREDLLIKKW